MSSWYDIAQICSNGHVVNKSIKEFPQRSKKFCNKCGASTITNCPNCNTEIQGQYYTERVRGLTPYKLPLFCHICGKPYPWTKTKIQAACELAKELENISEDEKEILAKSIDEIVKDTPRTTLAATRTKRILSKAGNPVVITAFREILVDIVSETVKKVLWPQ